MTAIDRLKAGGIPRSGDERPTDWDLTLAHAMVELLYRLEHLELHYNCHIHKPNTPPLTRYDPPQQ